MALGVYWVDWRTALGLARLKGGTHNRLGGMVGSFLGGVGGMLSSRR